jgi:Toastrack DUF4097
MSARYRPTAINASFRVGLLVAFVACAAPPALAQRLPFERSFDISDGAILDVSTMRGRIDVKSGEPGGVRVVGTVTIRVGWDVPSNAMELAHRIANRPPVQRDGNTVRLRDPSDAAERRAVIVSYEVRVPANSRVLTVSDSGATTIRGITGAVSVRTQSAAIDLNQLGGRTDVVTGSGAVAVEDIDDALSVEMGSGGFAGRSLGGKVRIRTRSGQVEASLSNRGDIDVETASSSVRLQGVRGALKVVTQSGRVTVQGAPNDGWDVTTGSGSVRLAIERGTGFSVDAANRSGSIKFDGAIVQGSVTKGKVIGTVSGGVPSFV